MMTQEGTMVCWKCHVCGKVMHCDDSVGHDISIVQHCDGTIEHNNVSIRRSYGTIGQYHDITEHCEISQWHSCVIIDFSVEKVGKNKD